MRTFEEVKNELQDKVRALLEQHRRIEEAIRKVKSSGNEDESGLTATIENLQTLFAHFFLEPDSLKKKEFLNELQATKKKRKEFEESVSNRLLIITGLEKELAKVISQRTRLSHQERKTGEFEEARDEVSQFYGERDFDSKVERFIYLAQSLECEEDARKFLEGLKGKA